MSLSAGTRLGAYDVLALIGAGGMGEVYKARDTKLGRDVALKILPPTFTTDPERLARFRREAQVLAALNHPHIGAIYGLEEVPSTSSGQAATQFLVLELVDGETLAQRIEGLRAKGSHLRASGASAGQAGLPVDEALAIAKQIAEALEAAHEKGIIHRDLKPANIALTKDGNVKVLDFGLAKATEAGTASIDLAHSPTLTLPAMMTGVGVILGTAAYMSPEQARGRVADKRSDVWAFGCVLYEMLTGRRAFEGEDATDVIAAVVRGEPDWNALPRDVPPHIRALITRCLEKDRKARFSDIAVVRYVMTDEGGVARAPQAIDGSTRPRSRGIGWREMIAWTAAALALGAIVYLRAGTDTPPVVRLTVPVAEPNPYDPTPAGSLAISPDGRRIVYAVRSAGGVPQLFQRRLDQLAATPMPGTEGAIGPFFSPDGQWVAFHAAASLKKVSINGGAALTISRTGQIRGASWGSDDTIYFSLNVGDSGLQRVSAAGGAPQAVNKPDKGARTLRWPQILPGGKALLYTAWTNSFDAATVYVQPLDTNEQRVVVRGGSDARYVSSGHVIYARAEGLFAVPFDLRKLQVTGQPVPVVEGVFTVNGSGDAEYAVSANGTLVYAPGGAQTGETSLMWVDRKGAQQLARAARALYLNAALSPDGSKAALEIASPSSDIWVYDLDRETLSRLTFDGVNGSPAWTPDGKRVTYRSQKANDPASNVYWKPADGSGPEERLTTEKMGQHMPNSWSGDGRVLTIEPTGGGLEFLTMAPKPALHPLLESPWNKDAPRISWDGKWLAYASTETGALQIYVQPFPALTGKWQISTEGGTYPRWRRDGKELYYISGGKVMQVSVTTDPAFKASKPALLFEGSYAQEFDVSADGSRFLMIKQSEQAAAAAHLNVVLNWFQELKQK